MRNYNDLIIDERKTVLDALEKLNTIRGFNNLILFVKSKNGEIVGSLTDGDIRRSLIINQKLNTLVGNICNRKFVYVKDSDEYVNFRPFKKKNIKMLPILNKSGFLVKVVDLEKNKSLLPMEAVIMAGGRGKRLSPFTDNTPKPMLILGNKPIIEHNIDRLISYGINKIYISINYFGDKIKNYFGDGSSKGISIEYINEDKPLGTAGSLALVSEYKSEHILIMNGDLFTNVNFEEMYLKIINHKAEMIVASVDYKVDIPYAVLNCENYKVNSFEEKPSYCYNSNAGVYILKKELVAMIPKNTFFDITDLMNKLLSKSAIILNSPVRGYWIDIGKPIDYKKAQEFLKHFD